MAKNDKFKVLSKDEIKELSEEERRDYKLKYKEYKASLKPKKSKTQKKMAFVKVIGAIMAIIMVLGVLAAILSPLIYISK